MRKAAGNPDAPARNKAVGAALVEGKLITAEQCDWLMRDAQLTEERIEDAIIYRGILPELELLKFLAAHYRTRFVSTERLSKAEIDRSTLGMIPRQVAETFNVFPVMFDANTRVLSVVIADPDNKPLLKEIQSVSAARDVQAFLARPAAIRAAVAKSYAGDPHAFTLLLNALQFGGNSRVVERDAVTSGGPPTTASAAVAAAHAVMRLEIDDGPIGGRISSHPGKAKVASPPPPPPPARSEGSGARPPPPPLPVRPHGTAPSPVQRSAPAQTPGLERSKALEAPRTPSLVLEMPTGITLPTMPQARPSAPVPPVPPTFAATAAATAAASIATPLVGQRAPSSIPPASARATVPPGGHSSAPPLEPESAVELVNVLVALLDSSRQDLRGHSSLTARLVRRLGERLSLPSRAVATIVLGAQLHDVGKSGPIHLTALNISEYESFKSAAQKALMTPTRLLGSANLPAEALEAVEQMYERYDGQGIPNGLAGKEISLGARMIAIADTYADLIENAGNNFRRQLTPQEACAVLVKNRETLFDPHLVDLFKSLVLGDDVRAKILSNRHRALLVDPDAEETTVLELRLIEQGFEVKTVRSMDTALRTLGENEFQLVVSELDLGRGDGLVLLKAVRGQPWGKDLPWVVYTRRQVRDEAQRAFEMGVLDFVAKPAQPDVLVAKLKALLDQRAAPQSAKAVSGVSGSLKEMSLPDLVQILSQGRKTGSLRIRGGGESGEIHFDAGQLVNALWGTLKGDTAFFAMLRLADGEFSLDPAFKPTERVINDSAEGLLLEGMRRMDEGL